MSELEKEKHHFWKVEGTVPLLLVFMILLQIFNGFTWTGKIEQRVDVLEKAQAASLTVAERLARIEEKLGAIDKRLERIERNDVGSRSK